MSDPINNFNILLDTTGPSGLAVTIGDGSAFIPTQTTTVSISHTATDVIQMKIWGDVDEEFNSSIKSTEETSAWISYASVTDIKLSTTDATKTIYVKLRDDVYNESNTVSAAVILDMTLPVVTLVSGPTPNKVSKIPSKDTSEFTFTVSEQFTEYKIMVVPSTATSAEAGGGVVIPITAGSVNMSGTGTFEQDTAITCTIKGTDLETASAGDGNKIVKIFVKDRAGNWSA